MRYLPFFLAASLATTVPNAASAQSWSLPASLSDSNTTITFKVDSTWHLVQGTTSKVTGSVRQQDPADPLSIEVDLTIPVASFDTDWDARDEKLAIVMAAELFANVRFRSTRLSADCHPLKVKNDGRCSGLLQGFLTIRDVTMPVSLPVEIVRSGSSDTITGKLMLQWADYHVEDPSILIAKLDPTVTIAYSTEVPLR